MVSDVFIVVLVWFYDGFMMLRQAFLVVFFALLCWLCRLLSMGRKPPKAGLKVKVFLSFLAVLRSRTNGAVVETNRETSQSTKQTEQVKNGEKPPSLKSNRFNSLSDPSAW